MNNIMGDIIKAIGKETQDNMNRFGVRSSLAKKHNYSYTLKKIHPIYKYMDDFYYDINGQEIIDKDCKLAISQIDGINKSIEFSIYIQNYLRNLNVIQSKNVSDHGMNCDGINLYVDNNIYTKYNLNEQLAIKFFYSLLPLINIHSIGKKGFNGKAGKFETSSLCLLGKHLGLFSYEKIRYSLSTRISENETLEGLTFNLPQLEWKYSTLENLINSKNPLFKIKSLIKLPNNPNISQLEIIQYSIRVNQSCGLHKEKVEFITFIDDNKILTLKNKDVKDWVTSQKMMDKLIS
jgi:hypothetical protein